MNKKQKRKRLARLREQQKQRNTYRSMYEETPTYDDDPYASLDSDRLLVEELSALLRKMEPRVNVLTPVLIVLIWGGMFGWLAQAPGISWDRFLWWSAPLAVLTAFLSWLSYQWSLLSRRSREVDQ